jgi:hypothetical protein
LLRTFRPGLQGPADFSLQEKVLAQHSQQRRHNPASTSPCGVLKKGTPPGLAPDGEGNKANQMYKQDSAAVKADSIATRKKRNAAWRGKLSKLTQHRYGNHFLPDNAEGRAMVVAFLRCRMRTDDVKERAPWITDNELQKLQSDASEIESIKELGELIGLTWDERMGPCRVYFLPACDVTPLEAACLQSDRNRENARKRQIRFRESKMKMRHTSIRDDAMLRMLATLPPISGWTPVSVLVKEAKRCDAFRRPDGRKLAPRSLRKTVHRVIEVLKAHGQIETTEKPGARGMVTLVRLVDLENCSQNDAQRYGFCHGDKVTAKKRPKTPNEQWLTRILAA